MQRNAEKCREIQRDADMQRHPHDLHYLYSEKCREGNSCLELTKRFFSYTVQCFSDLCWKIETLGNIWQIWHHNNRTTWQHDAVTKLLDNSYHIKVSKNDLSFTFTLYGGTLYDIHQTFNQSLRSATWRFPIGGWTNLKSILKIFHDVGMFHWRMLHPFAFRQNYTSLWC